MWNQTLGRSALVPHYNYYSSYFGFGDYGDDGKKGRDHDTNNDWYIEEPGEKTELNPEEEWMYMDWDRDSRLQTLTSNHHSTMLVGKSHWCIKDAYPTAQNYCVYNSSSTQ